MILTLLLTLSGCVTATPKPADPPQEVSGKVICDESAELRSAHVAALLETEDLRVRSTGVALIQVIDAGCAA